MGKYKSDYERLETVKEFKVSKMTISEFARKKGISRTTLRDWVNAYDNIDGEFVRMNKAIGTNEPGMIFKNETATMKIVKTEGLYHRKSHFSRFDHSVVVVEFDRIKITTSLEQALKILEQYYDRYK